MSTPIPTAPSGLSATARAWWRKVHVAWDLDDGGRVLLEVALRALDRAAEAAAAVKRDGAIIRDAKGTPRAHPALAIEKNAQLVLLKAWRQLGLEDAAPDPAMRRDSLGRAIGGKRR